MQQISVEASSKLIEVSRRQFGSQLAMVVQCIGVQV